MKRKLLLVVAFCTTFDIFSQDLKMKPVPVGKENLKPLIEVKMNEYPFAPTDALTKNKVSFVSPAPQQLPLAKTSAVNTWSNVTASPSPFGSLISYCNPLDYNDELNAVCFIHRRPNLYVTSPPSVGPSQQVNALISGDWGNSWDSTMVSDDPINWARYPGGAIYNPPLNTMISGAYAVVAGPTTPAAGSWNGNYFASKPLTTYNNAASTVTNAQQWMDILNPNPNVGRVDFAAYAFTSTDDGKVRALGGVQDANLAPAQDTALNMVTGTFNAGVFDYNGTIFRLEPIVSKDSMGGGGPNWLSRPMMAWNEAGTVGYVAVIGSNKLGTGSNSGLQPIVWKTTNSGASWALLPSINFNDTSYKKLKNNLTTTGTYTNLVVPHFLWTEGIDVAVDANNKLHLFSSLVGHYSGHRDSLYYSSTFTVTTPDEYRWPHLPGFRPYLYDFMTDGTSAWSYNLIDSMSSEGASDQPTGAGYNENPWSVNAGTKQRLDARIQVSRTPNGKYIFYSWTESDTNFTSSAKKYNVLPNVKVRAFGVDENLVSNNEVNITSPSTGLNPNVASMAFFHFMSTKSSSAAVNVLSSTLTTVSAKIPFTVSNNPGFISAAFSTTHWYNTAENTFSFVPKGVSVAENALNSVNSSVIFPNPANNRATLAVELKQNQKIGLTLFNLVGEEIRTFDVNGQAGVNEISIDLSDLVSGIYLVNIKIDNATSTKKLIVE